ncbi:MAG: hypothetical protein WCP91_00215 [Candidatus Berkelbacteria bacterium]
MAKQKKMTKGLLIVLGVLVIIAAALWILMNSGVSADVSGSTGETASDDSASSDVVKIDDAISTVSPGQTLNYTITVDTKKMFENMSGLVNPTEQQFNDWATKYKNDKLYLNAWLGNGKSTASNGWILGNPNFSVSLPALKYPLAEVTYTATGKVPVNIDLVKNTVYNTARIVRRPCHTATASEITASILNPPKLKATSLVCPMEGKIRVAQDVDMDKLSYKTNTTDLGILSYNVSDTSIAVDEAPLFTVQYKNLSNQIAGAAKLKIRYPENTFLIEDSSIKPAVKETIDGKKYDVYYINLGDMLPTVNGTMRTDAATIAGIKTALQAALVGNTDDALVKAINNAIKVCDGYAAGSKTLDNLLTAIKTANDLANEKDLAALNISKSKSIWSGLIGIIGRNTSIISNIPAATVNSSLLSIIGSTGSSAVSGLSSGLQAFLHGSAALSTLSPAMLAELTNFMNSHVSASDPHPAYVSPGFGAGTLTSLSQAMSYCGSLSASVDSPVEPLEIKYYAKALVQPVDVTRVVTYVELVTNSTDSDVSNNEASRSIVLLSPQMVLDSVRGK